MTSLKEVKAANNRPTSQPFLEALQLVNVGVSFPYCVRCAPLPPVSVMFTQQPTLPHAQVRAVETKLGHSGSSATPVECDARWPQTLYLCERSLHDKPLTGQVSSTVPLGRLCQSAPGGRAPPAAPPTVAKRDTSNSVFVLIIHVASLGGCENPVVLPLRCLDGVSVFFLE